MSATVCTPDVQRVRRWGETEDEGRRRKGRDGAWRKGTVNEAFLGSSEGLSSEEGIKSLPVLTSLERLREI